MSDTSAERLINPRLLDLINQQLGIPLDCITPDSHLRDDLGADDLDVAELEYETQTEFNFTIPEGEAAKLKRVTDWQVYISEHS